MLGIARRSSRAISRIPKNIESYQNHNNVKIFSFKKAVSRSKEEKPTNEFKDLWIHQTFIETKDQFPWSAEKRFGFLQLMAP